MILRLISVRNVVQIHRAIGGRSYQVWNQQRRGCFLKEMSLFIIFINNILAFSPLITILFPLNKNHMNFICSPNYFINISD